VDYLMADPVLIPMEEEVGFVERIVHLPCVIPFDPQGDEYPLIERPPMLRQNFITFGCLNRASKITEETFDLFTAVLKAVPGGRMLFKAHEYEQPRALERVVTGMVSRGIERGRIGVLGSTTTYKHLSTYEGVDLCLDPSPHAGGVTALEGLWMGVPPVTLIGRRPVSRLSASFMTALGLPEFIAHTPEEYVAIAKRVVADPQRLATLRCTMRERMRRSPLMGEQYVRAVEARYREFWHRWIDG
jgi:predicted O-linked N-acetylglucosamine transferase (SPINDLY family)